MTHNTVQLINQALDISWMQATVLSQNLAHSHSKDYHPTAVSFEKVLDEQSLNYSLNPIIKPINQPQSVDQQLLLSLENASHYRALIQGLNHHFNIMKIALQGNS